jgi:hypothetical protein
MTSDEREMPTNARLRLADGTEVPLELVFDHYRDGVRMFKATATARIPDTGVVELLADTMPPRTGIVLAIEGDADEVRWDCGGGDGSTGPLHG